jgi:hypothetical protein
MKNERQVQNLDIRSPSMTNESQGQSEVVSRQDGFRGGLKVRKDIHYNSIKLSNEEYDTNWEITFMERQFY